MSTIAEHRLHLLFPLIASLGYVLAVLLAKRAAALGSEVWRGTVYANVASAIVFTPQLLMGGHDRPWTELYQPAIVGLLFIAGQALTFYAVNVGDVSVATPVLGLKILFVAALSTALGARPVSAELWLAAALCTVAIGLLHAGGRQAGGRLGATIASAAGAAAAFALFDVLVMGWAPAWGSGRFLPLMFWIVAGLSVGWAVANRRPLWQMAAPARPWLLGSALCLAFQAVFIVTTIGVFGDATAVNIVYSSRSLWSVLAVWQAGHWFHNEERHLPAAVLRERLVGALLMMLAIALTLR